MSSTNRSDARKGHQFDHYITPDWIVEDYFRFVLTHDAIAPQREHHIKMAQIGIIDPCAGGTAEIEMPYPKIIGETEWFKESPLETIDIRFDSRASIVGDFLKINRGCLPDRVGYIISTPPYTIGQEFVDKSLDLVENGGIVAMLLRVGFLGSAKRYEWFKRHMPEFIVVHHKRPSFTSDGKTDSDYYAHFVWRKGYNPLEAKMILV